MEYVTGDICTCGDDFIVQQCNCLTISAHGLSQTLATRFPYANPYENRRSIGGRNLAIEGDRDVPGTIKIFYDLRDISQPRIVCLFGQWRPGKIQTPYFMNYPESSPPETSHQRELWFQEGWSRFIGFIRQAGYNRIVTVAVPYKIGCGLAGGSWERYQSYLTRIQENNRDIIRIRLYRLA
jgi:hypothetical protein